MDWIYTIWGSLYGLVDAVASWLLPLAVLAVAIRLVWGARDNGF